MDRGKRSLWGWGLEARFPDRETRRALGSMLEAVLGIEARELRDPEPMAPLLAPRLEVPSGLRAPVSTLAEDRARHAYGKSYPDLVRGFRGDFSSAPDAVVLPGNESEIEEVLAWAERASLAVIPFGGGSSVVSGVEAACPPAYAGVLSVDLSRLGKVLEVDPVSLAARVEAGVFGPELEEQLSAHGLTLRHYPQSFEYSTLGGWIATRAGGHFATERTRIDHFVQSVRMVTPRGVWASRRVPSSGAGPSPDTLVVGSEGSLGILTEAWIRVQRPPVARARATLLFDDFFSGARAVRALAQSRLAPSNARLLDPREAAMNQVGPGDRAVLLLGFESFGQELGPSMEQALVLCRQEGGILSGEPRYSGRGSGAGKEADRWKQAFFDAPYLRDVLVSLGILADTMETACTWDRFEELYRALSGELAELFDRFGEKGLVSCRITHAYPDGPAPYFTVITPVRFGSELERWREIKECVSEVILRAGGTITHHHAVGRMHLEWARRERPALFSAALREVKSVTDPAAIMNPGVLL